MEWYYELERKLLPSLIDAVRSVVANARCVEFDLLNGNIQVVLPRKVTLKTKRDLETAITSTGSKIMPEVPEWPVDIGPRQLKAFTSHLGPSPLISRPFNKPESVILFDIPLEHILSMRKAEQLIADARKEFTYTVAFALGGISILKRLSELVFEDTGPHNPFTVHDTADKFSNNFHLFPGLQWGNKREQIFLDWLCLIPGGSQILIFDTGSSGNGPRQIRNLIHKWVKEGQPLQPSRIRLLAIVDRKDEDQKPIDEMLTTKAGQKIHVTIEYHHVGRMLSEDCQSLLGQDSIRKLGFVQPVRDSCVIALLNEEGRPFHLIASSSTSGVYSALMSEAEREPDKATRVHLTAPRERAMVKKLLAYSERGEAAQLATARDLGFISADRFKQERNLLLKRYEEAFKAYPSQKWDFEHKRLIKMP